MSVIKDINVVYVAPIPKERSGIGEDVPAHVKLQWLDSQNRQCSHLLDLSANTIEEISNISNRPNKE